MKNYRAASRWQKIDCMPRDGKDLFLIAMKDGDIRIGGYQTKKKVFIVDGIDKPVSIDDVVLWACIFQYKEIFPGATNFGRKNTGKSKVI